MKYMGSKSRISKEILPIILKERKVDQWYVEPFCGGCNMIDKVDGLRIAADINAPLISLFREIQRGWKPPIISKDEYSEVRSNPDKFPGYLVGWCAFGVSYCGKYFGGYAGVVKTKDGIRDYQREALSALLKQSAKLSDVHFKISGYSDLSIPEKSIIYCDPPYKGTTGYGLQFSHDDFWEWVRGNSVQGHSIFVSEYSAPEDFQCIWEKKIKSSLSANGICGGNKESTEKLFVYNPQNRHSQC